MRSEAWRAWALAALLAVIPAHGAQALEVFACEPEWAALVRELAPAARVVSATHARQDPHHIEARPSLIAALRRADLAVCTGASLEAGWLPMLQQRAGNPRVQPRRPGMFFAAESVDLIDVAPDADRSMGDVHAEGNPHLHLDPDRLLQVANDLSRRMAALDPTNAATYEARRLQWSRDWQRRIEDWRARSAPLQGRAVVAQHGGFAYLWRWLGLRQTADLEPKPGLPPTPAHLAALISTVRETRPIAIVHALYHEPRPAIWLATQTGVQRLSLPSTVTDDARNATLGALFDDLLEQLLAAAAAAPS